MNAMLIGALKPLTTVDTIKLSSSITGEEAAATICIVRDAELFVMSKSVSLLETVAVLDICDTAVGVTVIVTVTVAPLAIVPREQTSGLPNTQPPWVVEAAPMVVVAGTGSFSITFVALAGPLFVTIIRKTNEEPTSPGFGDAVLLIDKSTLDGLTTFRFT
jgi:hypothetical protein